ncbi:MAG: peptide chain release factor N(5)-glutamine methyltransferase [Bacteroidetes bacterium]|nr:peptide chain release factor N(5)-glutamine methyltransferase [Bacteroidota bacterium]
MKIGSNKIRDIIRFFRDELKELYDEDELNSIISYCFEVYLNINRSQLVLKSDDTVSESELLKFNFAVKELKKHKPIQYILGRADFYRLPVFVNEYVLIPRPETEELVDLIIKDVKSSIANKGNTAVSILDIGTGSGCIPIALKKNLPMANVTAIDVSKDALDVAEKNSILNDTAVRFFYADILSPNQELMDSEYDIIVSNPPYIGVSEKHTISANVLEYEPHLALFVSSNDPLLFYRKICDFALQKLKKGGRIYFEINQLYGQETKELLENKGFKNVILIKDLNDNNRILHGNII